MAEERQEVSGFELSRWVIIAVIVAAGVGAAFWLAASTPPIAPPLREAE